MKKTILRKYSNIEYPIFTLRNKPQEIRYDKYTISCRMNPDSHIETVDDKRLSGDYFSRLLQLNIRLSFDYTCRNLQDLLFTKSKWGMDKNAMPHDFSELFAVPVEKRLVTRVINNIIWIKGISYPFELLTQEKVRLTDTTYATIVYVNGEWFLRELSNDSNLERPYMFV